MKPGRFCNGGPNGTAWCGKPATHVAGELVAGGRWFDWFCCGTELGHHERCGDKPGSRLVPLHEWFKMHGLPVPQ